MIDHETKKIAIDNFGNNALGKPKSYKSLKK